MIYHRKRLFCQLNNIFFYKKGHNSDKSSAKINLKNSDSLKFKEKSRSPTALYPPGRILHLVRSYPQQEQNAAEKITQLSKDSQESRSKKQLKNIFKKNFSKLSTKAAPVKAAMPFFKIIETDNKELNEILISPRMLQDHLPDNIIKCMKAVRKASLFKKKIYFL